MKEKRTIIKTWTDPQLIEHFENNKNHVTTLTSIDFKIFADVTREMVIRGLKME